MSKEIRLTILKLFADRKSPRGVGKALGGILIVIAVIAGAVFLMVGIGTGKNATIVACTVSLSDKALMWEGSAANANAMRESFNTIELCIDEMCAELQARATNQRG